MVYPRKNGLVNVRVGSRAWMDENMDARTFGDAAFGTCMAFYGDRHFSTISIALMITPSLIPTSEGYRQHMDTLHSLIHNSHGQLGTDLTQNPNEPIMFLNARVCSPYCRAFMTLVRSPLYNHMLRNGISPVFMFRGMMIQSPRAGQFIISTQDTGKHGHSLIALVGGIQGCDASERFKALDHFPRVLHIEYRADGQGNHFPRLQADSDTLDIKLICGITSSM